MLKLRNIRIWKLYRCYATRAKRGLTAQRKAEYGKVFPEILLSKKQKTPPALYMAKHEAANAISSAIEPYLPPCDTILEINPGSGIMAKKWLDYENFRKILLIESYDHFLPNLEELHSVYPDRVKVRRGDLVSIWKTVYQDKMDNGTRTSELLKDVPKRDYNDGPNMMLFGGVGSYNFFKHLINSLVFQNSLFSYGRCEMFLVVPPPMYIHLTCSNEIGYMIYRATSMLFQIMFEHQLITTLPREWFLPSQAKYNPEKGSKMGRINSIDPEHLYLVKIVPRRTLYEVCPVEDLQALWYFVKQNSVSRRNRIIPNLEKFVPGCGPRLIINPSESKPVQPLFPNENVSSLPKYSMPSTTMSNKDFYPHINIYTQFGDLSPSQMLTLFCQFRHWPEYKESSFLASLENSLLKMEAVAEESAVDAIPISEEDDMGGEISADTIATGTTTKSTTQQKKIPPLRNSRKSKISQDNN